MIRSNNSYAFDAQLHSQKMRSGFENNQIGIFATGSDKLI